MIKLLIFWSAALLLFLGGIVLRIVIPPKFRVQAVRDEASRTIRCTVSVARLLGRSIRLSSIWIPVEYVRALGASPPAGFKERHRVMPEWLYDNAKREVVIWSGRRELPKGSTIELSIPAAHPKAISGTMQFYFECWGLAKVGVSGDCVHVPLNSDEG
jgi:hypothetical protein